MIHFFQRHKKIRNIIYATVVFTFVGAGFMGYGTVSLNNKNIIKTIGNKDITNFDLNIEINHIINEKFKDYSGVDKYSQIKKFTRDNDRYLKQLALINLTNKYIKLNFAEQLGLSVSNEELFDAISSDKSFSKNGKFNIEVYKNSLKNSLFTPASFENLIKNILLIKKLDLALAKGVRPLKEELSIFKKINNFNKVVIGEYIYLNNNDINNTIISKKQHLEFWNKNKKNYFYPKSIQVAFFKINKDINSSFNIFKKHSLKTMLQLKSNKLIFQEKKEIFAYEDKKLFEILSKFSKNQVLKPIYNKEKNISYIYKIINKIDNKIKTFDEAKKESLFDAKRYFLSLKIKNNFKKAQLKNNASNFIGDFNNKSGIPDLLKKKIKDDFISETIFNKILNSKKSEDIFINDNYIFRYKVIEVNYIKNKEIFDFEDNQIFNFLFEYKSKLFINYYKDF